MSDTLFAIGICAIEIDLNEKIIFLVVPKIQLHQSIIMI